MLGKSGRGDGRLLHGSSRRDDCASQRTNIQPSYSPSKLNLQLSKGGWGGSRPAANFLFSTYQDTGFRKQHTHRHKNQVNYPSRQFECLLLFGAYLLLNNVVFDLINECFCKHKKKSKLFVSPAHLFSLQNENLVKFNWNICKTKLDNIIRATISKQRLIYKRLNK